MTGFDKLAAICFGFMMVPVLAFLIVVALQWRYIDATNYRQTILSARAALFLPGYAFWLWISVVAPPSFYAMTVLINLVEGYSFYTFFSLLLFNLGGSDQAVDTLVKADKPYFLFSCCFPAQDKVKFYRRTAWGLFHMLFTRVVLSIIGAIAFYSGSKAGEALALVIQVINAVLVIIMIVHVINFYEMMFEHAKNLFGLTKLFLLKCSVGLIVLEGLIANFLVNSGKSPYSSDDGDDTYDMEEKTQRGYCALVLIELMILSLIYVYAFGIVKIKPSSAPGFDNSKNSAGENITWKSFCCALWSFHDVLGTHGIKSETKQPLAGNAV